MTNINVPPRDFKVGDDVVCLNCGKGKIVEYSGVVYSVLVAFDDGLSERYTETGKLQPHYVDRCLFHADENVKVTVTESEPVYKYQVLYKLKGGMTWHLSNGSYKSVKEYKFNSEDLDNYESIELFLPSKRLVQNDE